MNRADLARLVGLNIGRARARTRHTQGWLAEQVGVCRATVSRYENGHELAPLDVLVTAADALGCPLTALLLGLVDEAVGA